MKRICFCRRGNFRDLFYQRSWSSQGKLKRNKVNLIRCYIDEEDTSDDDDVFVFIRKISPDTIEYAVGRAEDFAHEKAENLSAPTIGGDLLKPSIQGNFRGCQIRKLTNEDKRDVLKRLKNVSCAGILTGVPGTEKDNENFQGVDRLINVMAEDEFGFMVIARPLIGAEESKNSSSGKTETTSHTAQKNISNQQQATAGQTSGKQHSLSSSFNRNERDATNTNLVTEKDNNNVVKKSKDQNDSVDRSGGNSAGANYSEQNQTSYIFGYQVSSTDNTTNSTQKSDSVSQSSSENSSLMTMENKTTATT